VGKRILIEIPTKNRDLVLGQHMAALILQSYQDFDVLILNDGDQPVGKTLLTEMLLPYLSIDRKVWVERGSHISQAHNHNVPLYDPRFADYRYYIRADDDVFLDRDAVGNMVRTITETGAAAVGGLWMEQEILDNIHDRKIFWTAEDFAAEPSINGCVDMLNSNWQQRVYHPTDELMEVEHVYSVAIIDMEKMRDVGGFPEVYSKGVAHGEETDGTSKLHFAGYKLYIDPTVTGQHLRSSGGIRSSRNLSEIQHMDLAKWQARLPQLRQINWTPKIAVECRHSIGLGGAERLFYNTISVLQSKFGQENVHPVFPCPPMSPQEVNEAFGLTYALPDGPEEEYDVLIVIGHEPQHGTQAKHKIFYCLFPIDGVTYDQLDEFDQVVGISDYTCEQIAELWRVESKKIYPPVRPIKYYGEKLITTTPAITASIGVLKENIILIVSRCVPYKAPRWLMERFLDMKLEDWRLKDWEFHAVLSTSVEAFEEYDIDVMAFAEEHDSIHVHRDVSDLELRKLYRRARILWGANGMRGEEKAAAEHFGYTPIEAWSAECYPVMFSRGGHRETVDGHYLWDDIEGLERVTNSIISGELHSGEFNPVDLTLYEMSTYMHAWEQLITRVNGMALELQRVEQIDIEDRPIRVAFISDSPYLPDYGIGVTSGFGNVAGQIAQRFLDEPDIRPTFLGMYDPHMPKREDNLPFDFFPPIGDIGGRHIIPAYLQWAEPDVIFALHAPGELNGWIQQFRTLPGLDQPVVAYFPVEGAGRLNPAVVPLMEKVKFPVTYCHAGASLIRQFAPDGELWVAYHGIDHADFAPLEEKDRNQYRKLVGLDDKFVVMAVGTNKRVKQHSVMIDAMKILLSVGYDDIVMYLHTKEFDEHVLQGHALRSMVQMDEHITGLPLSKHVLFPVIEDKWHSSPYESEVTAAWKYVTPGNPKMRGALFNSLDLVTRYGIADLYVDVSSAEGFGLCPLEAVACGVPMITVHDDMVRDEVHARYATEMLDPAYWDTWHTGTRLAMVTPEDVAAAIIRVYKNRPSRERLETLSEDVRIGLPWREATSLFAELVREAYALRSMSRT